MATIFKLTPAGLEKTCESHYQILDGSVLCQQGAWC